MNGRRRSGQEVGGVMDELKQEMLQSVERMKYAYPGNIEWDALCADVLEGNIEDEEIQVGDHMFRVLFKNDIEYWVDEEGLIHTHIWIVPRESIKRVV